MGLRSQTQLSDFTFFLSFFQKVEQFVYGTYVVGCVWKDTMKSLLLKAVFHVEVLANWKHL